MGMSLGGVDVAVAVCLDAAGVHRSKIAGLETQNAPHLEAIDYFRAPPPAFAVPTRMGLEGGGGRPAWPPVGDSS
jgi:hypothetical protein